MKCQDRLVDSFHVVEELISTHNIPLHDPALRYQAALISTIFPCLKPTESPDSS
jgi:hypothetical protein